MKRGKGEKRRVGSGATGKVKFVLSKRGSGLEHLHHQKRRRLAEEKNNNKEEREERLFLPPDRGGTWF